VEHTDDDGPVTVYFGQRWDAPTLDGRTRQIDPPAGEKCLHCSEPIEASDRGLLRLAIREDVNGKSVGAMEPTHLECDLRSALGNVTHMSGAGHHVGDCQDEPGTMREQGLAVLDYINQQRARVGMKPM